MGRCTGIHIPVIVRRLKLHSVEHWRQVRGLEIMSRSQESSSCITVLWGPTKNTLLTMRNRRSLPMATTPLNRSREEWTWWIKGRPWSNPRWIEKGLRLRLLGLMSPRFIPPLEELCFFFLLPLNCPITVDRPPAPTEPPNEPQKEVVVATRAIEEEDKDESSWFF